MRAELYAQLAEAALARRAAGRPPRRVGLGWRATPNLAASPSLTLTLTLTPACLTRTLNPNPNHPHPTLIAAQTAGRGPEGRADPNPY